MYLSIKGFRNIQQYECELQSESITLISGPSGIGKTTLMNAIYWCLYGTLKNVRKFGTKTGICMTRIEFGDVKITRSKSPESLTYEDTEKNISYKDEEAQQKIIQLFGNVDIWLSSCYLRQGTRNKFLDSSPSERLCLLSELCFSSNSPEIYVERIDEKTKEIIREFERQNDFYKRDLEMFQKRRKEYPNYQSDLLDDQKKDSLQQFLKSDLLSVLHERLSVAERLESSYLSLSDTRRQLVEKFPNYREYLLDTTEKKRLQERSMMSPKHLVASVDEMQNEIWDLEKKKIFHQSYQQQYNAKSLILPDHRVKLLTSKQKTDLENHISTLVTREKKWRESETQRANHINLTKQLEEYTKDLLSLPDGDKMRSTIDLLSTEMETLNEMTMDRMMIDRLQTKWNSFLDVFSDDSIVPRPVGVEEMNRSILVERVCEDRRRLLQSLSIKDDRESVEKAIEIRRRVCEVQHLWNMISELQDLESQLNGYDDKIHGLGKRKDWISDEDMSKKVLELNSARELLTCPKCSTSLRFESNRLVECHVGWSKEKIENLSRLIDDSRRRNEWLQLRTKIESEMNHKSELFEMNCQKMNLSPEKVYEYPKLEDPERQKLQQEIFELEKYLSSYDETFESVETLEKCRRKWEAMNLHDEMERLSSRWKDMTFREMDVVKSEKDSWVTMLMKYDFLSEMIKKTKTNIEECSWEELTDENFGAELERSRKDLELHEIAEEMETLWSKMQETFVDDVILETKKRQLDEKRQKIDLEREEIEECRRRLGLSGSAETIRELDDRISQIVFEDVNSLKLEICKLKSEIEEKKERLLRFEKASEMQNERKKLEQQRCEVVDVSNRVSMMSMMKSIANELEHKRMISILDTINDFANELLTILFDDPIKIEFMVYKKSKTNDKVKPSIVYKLLYRGHEIDHVDQLSGGEGDRVSLAVTCALFQFSRFPFLMLDEFASSLDLNTKETAIKSLKTFLGIGRTLTDVPYKSILCISHDTVEGIYDHVISFRA